MNRTMHENAIMDVKRRYFHGVDSKDWALYASVFTVDATMDMSGATSPSVPVVHGQGAIVEFVRTTMEGITSIHHGYLRTLEFDADDRASGLWAMEDILFTGPTGALRKILHGYGHYHEEYRLETGIWRCSNLKLTRIHVELQDWPSA